MVTKKQLTKNPIKFSRRFCGIPVYASVIITILGLGGKQVCGELRMLLILKKTKKLVSNLLH